MEDNEEKCESCGKPTLTSELEIYGGICIRCWEEDNNFI
jgi:hypothetical protein